MRLTVLRSTLCLLAMGVLLTDGAMAQSSDGCVKYTGENSNLLLISVHLREQGTALTEVSINTEGNNVTSCSVVKGSGSERLDGASCDWVKDHWHSLGRCQNYGLQL